MALGENAGRDATHMPNTETSRSDRVDQRYLGLFLDEAESTLDEMAQWLIRYEQNDHRDLAAEEGLTNLAHRIKGSAAAIGLARVAEVAHAVEDHLASGFAGTPGQAAATIDLLLDGVDSLRKYVENVRRSGTSDDVLLEVPVALMEPPGIRPRQIASCFDEQDLEPLSSEQDATDDPATGDSALATIRVDLARLDGIMHLVERLGMRRARIDEQVDRMAQLILGEARKPRSRERVEDRPVDGERRRSVHACLDGIREQLQQIDGVADQLRSAVMSARMVPIAPLFGRFPKVVRDAARATGKQISLSIRGESTELDKCMIDGLFEPLVHLVRNAADHGIESADERSAAGKPPEGQVVLWARHCGTSVAIVLQDDGRGIDIEAIRRRGLERGLITAEDADAASPRDLIELIWQPGFSTTDRVSELSGRGVGMDIVREKIRILRGTIQIDSTPGRGTTVRLELPLTLSVVPCLLVEEGSVPYAIPLQNVRRLADMDPQAAGAPECLMLDGRRPLAVMTIGELFRDATSTGDAVENANLAREDAAPAMMAPQRVVLEDRDHAVALPVDKVIGRKDLVVKSILRNYGSIDGIGGAAELGDGRVALVLNVSELLDGAANRRSSQTTAKHRRILS